MKKIKLCGIEYELPKINTRVMAELEDYGYEMGKATIFKNLVKALSFITKKEIDEVYEMIDRSIESGENNLLQINETIFGWIGESDFFRKAFPQGQ